jgi:DNA-binding response OmpR family regulator
MTPRTSERARVLLADDDESTRITLGVLLEDAGYDVDLAASCAAARALLAREVRYDKVLLDYHLGDGLGTDLIREARKRLPDARIILMSGSAGTGGSRHAADGCFVKGAVFDDLLRLLSPPQGRGPGDPR